MNHPNPVAPLGEITVLGGPCHIYPPTARDLRALLVLRDLATATAASNDLFGSLRPEHLDALCSLLEQLSMVEVHRDLPLDQLVTAAAELIEQLPALWAPYIAGTLTPALQRLSTLAGQFAAASAAGTAPEA